MKLQESFGDRIKANEPMDKRSTYRIGGPADFYFEAKTAEEASAAITAAREDGLPVAVLGGGSNILVSDAGVRGLVLVPANHDIKIDGERVAAGAGAPLPLLVNLSVDAGLAGLEWAAGIPGTVGGAVRGNAGAYGGEIKDVLESAEAINLTTGERKIFNNDECAFAYRESFFKKEPWLIWTTYFKLKTGDAAALKSRVSELILTRRGKYPMQYGNAGSVFKNVPFVDPAELPEKVRATLPEKYIGFHKVPAAWLIEKLDLKGKTIGKAMVSEEHGNFIVNTGGATAEEVIQLISYVKMKVRDELGIQLAEEIEYVGF